MASITIEGILFGGVQCQIVDINFSRSRLIDARDQVHQRALATAARSIESYEFILRHLKRDSVDGSHFASVAGIIPMHVDE